jgi:HlyD family secretion protein
MVQVRTVLLIISAAGILLGCNNGAEESDAYGQFEADEIKVAAQANGQLTHWTAREGEKLNTGDRIGQVDSTDLHLRKAELDARRSQIQARFQQLQAELNVLEAQQKIARREVNRVKALVQDSAATEKQLDDAQDQVTILDKKMAATNTQRASLQAELKTIQANRKQLDEQLRKTRITAPANGRILNTFVEEGEVVRFGQPVLEMANLDTLELRVFVSGAQLPHITLGQQVTVLVDQSADELQQMPGTIRWISDQAEFTPQAIQTREERVTQVYAVKVAVPNPKGILKIGMPGEINWK